MSAPGQTLELPLTDVESGRALPPNCTVVIKAEQMSPADNRVVRGGWVQEGGGLGVVCVCWGAGGLWESALLLFA